VTEDGAAAEPNTYQSTSIEQPSDTTAPFGESTHEQDPALTLSLADVAEVLAEHERTLGDVDERSAATDQLARRLAEVLRAVTTGSDENLPSLPNLDQRMAAVETALRRVLGQDGQRKPSRWSWQHIGAEAARELWRNLAEFVTWLDQRYLSGAGVDALRIPSCWHQHPVVVEELTALMTAWRAAYCAGDKPNEAMAGWHSRHLWPTLDRLAKYGGFRDCHRGHTEPAMRPQPLNHGLAQTIANDVAQRE
jgi:hypothetical protein